MSDYVTSLVRTWVPVAVGSAVTWLGSTADIVVGDDATQGGIMFFTALVTGAYYALARLLERKFPWAGILLGKPSQPNYTQ